MGLNHTRGAGTRACHAGTRPGAWWGRLQSARRLQPALLCFLTFTSLATALDRKAPLRSETVTIPALRAGGAYSLLVSVDTLRAFAPDSRVAVKLAQGDITLVSKTLHLGDPDLYSGFRAPRTGPAQLAIEIASPLASPANARIVVLPFAPGSPVELEPNDRWEDANPAPLGSTVFGSADEIPYIPFGSLPPTAETPADWFRFEFKEPSPKLVYFQIDLMERDNLPVDVSVFRVVDGKAIAFNDGEDPVTLPHEVQALPGNKFTTRVLKQQGTYYIRVRANHPEYKLRTRVYDAPPYSDPRQAVRTAVDYLLGAGDSWHANTPRRGGIFDRVSSVHQETSLCVACHATHFTQRGALYAKRNGYPIVQRQQLQFLTERFYNNPRPFYGFEREGAVWARVISAPANVLSRMSVLLDMFETDVSGVRRDRFHTSVAEYLKLYYKDRAKLPPNETNGNTPLVSAYEVAWYSWKVTGDARIADLVEQDEIKDTIDLCYQTLALAGIDRTKHKEKIQRNAGRILSLQRPSGQWSMRFDSAQAEVEFQTGHALWALHAAGIPADHPQVAKAIQYLLGRQQQFGGWMDPLQSFENFRTPFRETQMAVLALSSYFPGPDVKKGWDAPKTAAGTLLQLDAMWDAPSPAAIDRAIHAARSPEVLVRQQAIEALGRSAPGKFARLFEQALSDPSKLVQRTAAWSLRQSVVQAASPAQPDNILLSSLRSPGDRTRWAATRVFATHFSALAHRPGFAQALATLVDDPIPTVRMQALKGLWQFWFWTPADASKNLIEDTFLAAIAKPQHPWVDRNLREGIYNLADDNIRYLYNNWIPLLADPADRERAIRGRLDIEARLADKFSGVLERGAGLERKRLLSGLTEFHLRRGDVYDVKADHTRPAPPVYNRIGNDIEQSAFFGPANDRFARAVLPLLASSDPEMRRLALNAAVLARPVRFPGVNEAAGDPGQGRALLTAALQQTRPEPAEVLRAFGQAPRGAAGPQAAPRRQPTRYGRPDESYFRGRVEPILERRGKDGFACIHCHASHTIFNGQYGTVMNVVDLNDPENSLLLRKPISSAETEGTLGSATLPHGGGVRWEKGSPEYQTILDWIKGAK